MQQEVTMESDKFLTNQIKVHTKMKAKTEPLALATMQQEVTKESGKCFENQMKFHSKMKSRTGTLAPAIMGQEVTEESDRCFKNHKEFHNKIKAKSKISNGIMSRNGQKLSFDNDTVKFRWTRSQYLREMNKEEALTSTERIATMNGARNKTYSHKTRQLLCSTEKGSDCEIVYEHRVETLLFKTVDSKWQKEKATAFGLKIKAALQVGESKTVSVHERPKRVVPIIGDGNCFFRAISHALTGSQMDHKTVRQKVVEYIHENKKVFYNIANCTTYLPTSNMASLGVWATEVEIFAVASLLNTTVCIYSPYGRRHKWQAYCPCKRTSSKFRRTKKTLYISNSYHHFQPVFFM